MISKELKMGSIIQPKQRNHKNIFESFDILKELQKNHFSILGKPGSPIDKSIAHLNKNDGKGFTLSFEDPTHSYFNFEDLTNITIETSKHSLYIDKVLINSVSLPNVSGNVFTFYSQDFDKKMPTYFRLIVPLKRKIDFHFYIEHYHYETKKNRSSECVRVKYKDAIQDLYFYHDQEAVSYLIIDSPAQMTFDTFSNYCFSTLLSYGYITGKFPQDEGYFFAYGKADLKEATSFFYTEFRDSLFTLYTPIYSNSYGIIRDKKIAKQVYKTLRTLSLKEFSRLCQWANDSTELASILILIIESGTSSLLVMPSGFSIALEGLTELIVQKNEEKVAPIKNKNLAKIIRSELNQVIKKHSSAIDPDGIAILKTRVEQINQLTNRSKLRKPFELLKFRLVEEDDNAIDHRNDFLHGRITLSISDAKTVSGEEIKVANEKIYYVAMRLYDLLSILILKSIGYDNKILNHPKIHENVHKRKLDEPFFRQL